MATGMDKPVDEVDPQPADTHALNDQLTDWDREHFWHSFTQMQDYQPLVIERADGIWLETTDGQRLIDAASSMWCNVHGHNHPVINAAIRDQLGRVAHCTSLGMGNDTTIRLAKRLADMAPGNLRRVLFSSDGSSAIEVALKAAFQYWQQCDNHGGGPRPEKTKFLAFGDAYHGDTVGAASVGGIGRFHSLFQPLLFDVVRAPLPNRDAVPLEVNPADAAAYYLEQLEPLFAEHAHELAAVVIEPLVQCAAGMVMHPPGFLAGLRELATRHDVLLIADEVAVGFGKTGTMFACEQEGVVPDFLCLGKGLTGGYLPMAVTITNDAIYEAFLGDAASGRQLYHGHTFCGNPLAAAAAMACLDVFEQQQLLDALPAKFQRLSGWFDRLAQHPAVTSTRQTGIIAAANFDTARELSGDQPIGRQVAAEALRRGVWLRPQPHMLYVMPPLAISLEEIDQMMTIVEQSIEVATGTHR
ncbi:MAG: adenosylmethionine--8-amino-7-oxononanoate transaminase [Planctomycetota bacterium]